MIYETTLAPSNIIIKDSKGNVVIDAEAFDLDVLISQAIAGVNTSDPEQTPLWVERFRTLLHDQFELPPDTLNRTNTWQLIEMVQLAMGELKKKVRSMPMSQNSTESTPSN